MRIGQRSRKQKRKKNVPTKYKSANILLSFYPTAPEPSEIDFPAQSTSEIDLMYFFPIPVHPCHPVGTRLAGGSSAIPSTLNSAGD